MPELPEVETMCRGIASIVGTANYRGRAAEIVVAVDYHRTASPAASPAALRASHTNR